MKTFLLLEKIKKRVKLNYIRKWVDTLSKEIDPDGILPTYDEQVRDKRENYIISIKIKVSSR